MFICGNNESAKQTVTGILDEFGWKTADMGMVEATRAIEPLCMLWCLPGLPAQSSGRMRSSCCGYVERLYGAGVSACA